MKKRFLLMGAAAVLVMATMVGGTLAAGQVSGNQAANAPLAALEVRITLNGEEGELLPEPMATDAPGTLQVPFDKSYMPGDIIPLSTKGEPGAFSVTNEGSVDAYIRVVVDKYWADSWQTLDANELKPVVASSKWKEADEAIFTDKESGEHIVYYYTEPLAVGQTTEPLLSGIELPSTLDNTFSEQGIELHANAQAVQFTGAQTNELNQKAILNAWGVLATLDGAGNITYIQQ